MARRKLGELLLEAGLIDEAQLRSALADQRRWGRSLGRTVVEMRMVTEEALVRVLAPQLGVQSIDLELYDIVPHVLTLVPPELARSAHLVPFEQVGKFLDVAMADPQNLGVIDELRIRTQLNIRPYLCGPHQIERTVARYYGDGLPPEVTVRFESPDAIEAVVPVGAQGHVRPPAAGDILRRYPRTIAPPPAGAPAAELHDAEIASLQHRISKLEALVARDEEVLRKLLALLVDKGLATRDEIVDRLG